MSVVDLNRTMFFRTKFDVRDVNGGDVLWKVVLQVREWVRRKALRSGYSIPLDPRVWTSIKNSGKLQAEGADVSLDSCFHKDGDNCSWACRLVENVDLRDGTAPRQWVTEVGFEGWGLSEGSLSIVLSYGDRPGFIGPLQDEPEDSVPNLVKNLLSDHSIRSSISGIDLRERLIRVNDGTLAETLSIITKEDREVPVVLVCCSGDGAVPVSPELLSETLSANALVYYADDPAYVRKLNDELGRVGMECYLGAVRVYAARPHPGNLSDYLRHRYIPSSELERRGGPWLVSMLRKAIAQDVSIWQSMVRIEDVRRLNRESYRRREIEEIRLQYLGNQDKILEDMIGYEDQIEELLAEQEALERRVKESEATNAALRAKCDAFEGALNSRKNSSVVNDEVRSLLQTAKKIDCKTVGKLIVLLFPNRIDFTKRGWKSLEDCCTNPLVLWQALYDMCVVLQPLYVDKPGENVGKLFRQKSAFEISRESAQTRSNPALMKQRDDVYDGKPIAIERHLKSGTGNPGSGTFVRVYYDTVGDRIIVGECAKHLDTITTSSL
ncbi:hypothetical protein B5F74_10395 [Collinsella sp. An271]|uniref:hypothetical protein n=1 Tax=Collinsella sp. An271 TaxID=1965616 RepID=UPI000B366E07|nr:hypothetical protein [Collinsella sp. An271]OUO58383.1 hypothetical protein B5F74_10395 [Collinsella sp. An271]